MSPRRLLLQSLLYHRGVNVAAALGVAVGAAVLAGALLVGDSVRGSLRDLTLDRLGRIDQALVADRWFRQELADEIRPAATPAVLLRGSAEAPGSGSRAARVNLHGVDERFWNLFSLEREALGPREAILNESLARELSVAPGAAVLLRFRADTLIPSESVMGRKSDNLRTLRLTVKDVLPDRGAGRFGLSPTQQLPLNAFVPLAAVQRALEQPGRVNALFASDAPGVDGAARTQQALREAITLDDVELEARPFDGGVDVRTGRIVLERAAVEAIEAAAAETGAETTPALTYLANSIAVGERTIPYSTVSALGSVEGLTLRNGAGAAAPRGAEILLNDWAARDLDAEPGDAARLDYYVVGPRGGLATESREFIVAGVVRMTGLALDRDLAPRYEGMSDVDRMGDWDPPFPVDLSRIRPVDEDYWDDYRTAPKAFISLERAKELWTNRFGQLTSIRVSPAEGFEEALRSRLDPEAFGLRFEAVKAQGLEASSGATDFAGLFLGFSLFLIASAALLTTLLFRLGVERRAREIGLLLAGGWEVGQVRRMLLAEGAVTAAVGCVIGLPAAVGYGALMVHGLTTWWSAAVGGSFLQLHVEAGSLIGGAAAAFLLMLGAIWSALRGLERRPVRGLLAGAFVGEAEIGSDARPRRIAAIGFAAAAALSAGAFFVEGAARAGLFFGVGALVLTAALARFRAALVAPARATSAVQGAAAIWRLGVRNGARFPARSMLSAALMAGAAFVIVAVALMRHDVVGREPSRDSGDGGYRLIAESQVPLHQEQLAESDAAITPLRRRLGEDASCLNLYRPSEPTLVGASPAMIERGGFAFQSSLAETPEERANPWLLLDKEFPDGAVPVFGDVNSVQWILHLGLGQSLEVDDGQGGRVKLVIAGLLSRSVFQSELILAESRFLTLFPDHSGYDFFLIDAPDASLAAELESRWGEWGFDATTTAARLAGFLAVENTYLSTFQALGGLGLLLGALGLAVVMVRNVIERRGELALLRAVGFGERALSKLVLAENGSLLLFGVGAGAGAALLASAPQLISGQAEPPWLSLAATLAAIVAAGLAAGAIAVRAALRAPLLGSLRKE